MKIHSELNLLLELLRTNMLSFTPERMVSESQNRVQESGHGSCQSKNINSTVSDTVRTSLRKDCIIEKKKYFCYHLGMLEYITEEIIRLMNE